ncbi:hypothetical protein BJ875DRAFT_469758 [Amylocarpus encephaloides]|uniref:SMP-30/Gluconolactonase/LRE-like region domain-containing protein n=1 Tax=Amylocarpus encephaloides TaxID=45428 RepID=A0A9P7YDS2_9HELO|nr:hypothetical protein BJ875DRAFT_469758 [Amylocarpus encephaloides]
MLLRTISLWLMPLLLGNVQSIRVKVSQEFPKGSEIENMALRPCGSVLANVYTTPTIFEVPVIPNAKPKLIYTFQNAKGVSSIAYSSTPDEYFVVTGNFSFQTFSPTPNSYAIHRLSFDKHTDKPTSRKLAQLDAIAQPNGITHVPNTPYVLIADCRAGFVFRFNPKTLELTKYFDHPLLKPVGDIVLFGVNGIKLSRGYLYFSNTNQQLVARIKASGKEASLVGNPEVVATGLPVDDFIVDNHNGDLYLTANGDSNTLSVVNKDTGLTPRILYGGLNSTDLLFPTAAIWAKRAEGQLLIVSNSGDGTQFITEEYTGGGRLNFVKVGRRLKQ